MALRPAGLPSPRYHRLLPGPMDILSTSSSSPILPMDQQQPMDRCSTVVDSPTRAGIHTSKQKGFGWWLLVHLNLFTRHNAPGRVAIAPKRNHTKPQRKHLLQQESSHQCNRLRHGIAHTPGPRQPTPRPADLRTLPIQSNPIHNKQAASGHYAVETRDLGCMRSTSARSGSRAPTGGARSVAAPH